MNTTVMYFSELKAPSVSVQCFKICLAMPM